MSERDLALTGLGQCIGTLDSGARSMRRLSLELSRFGAVVKAHRSIRKRQFRAKWLAVVQRFNVAKRGLVG